MLFTPKYMFIKFKKLKERKQIFLLRNYFQNLVLVKNIHYNFKIKEYTVGS